jgi:hypothetical protein
MPCATLAWLQRQSYVQNTMIPWMTLPHALIRVEGMSEWTIGVGVVMAWPLPGSVLMRECAMLLPAAVLWSCVHMEKPVAEGSHA